MPSFTTLRPVLPPQEIEDAAALQQGMKVGPLERQRKLRWQERLRATQPSLLTQVMLVLPCVMTMQGQDASPPKVELLHRFQRLCKDSCRVWRNNCLSLIEQAPNLQEPILSLRRQLAMLGAADADAEAGGCWLQLAKLCRVNHHHEAAMTASLEALARKAMGAAREHARLLWAMGQPHRAVAGLEQVSHPACQHLAHPALDGSGQPGPLCGVPPTDRSLCARMSASGCCCSVPQ